jgi:sigma-B regulation protein RsbU (phosphoserine phosphatase)
LIAGQSQAPSILVVEDNPVSAEFVRQVLARSGFAVTVAGTAAEGLETAHAIVPDLILLDVLLPDGDGFSLCTSLKTDPALAQTPIIFVTSLEDVQSRVKGLSIGAVDFIQKPFAAEEIVARVRIHIKIARQARQIAEGQASRLAELRQAQLQFNTDPSSLPGAHCLVHFEPSAEAGGDQYDLVELGNDLYGFLVADIAGHGLETVFLASAFKALFRENASLLDSPSETLYMMNRSLKQHMAEGQHLTAFYLMLNRKAHSGSCACAGHLPCLMVKPDGSITRLAPEGDVLGAFAKPRFQSLSFVAGTGSRFWFYTDGVLEDFTTGRSWRAGLELLEASVSRHHSLPADQALAAVRMEVLPHGPGLDDRIIMVVDL